MSYHPSGARHLRRLLEGKEPARSPVRERQQRAVDGNIAAIRAVRQIRAAVAPLSLIAEMQTAANDGPEERAYEEAVRRQLADLRAQEQEYVDDLEALAAEGVSVPAAYKRVEA